MTSFAFEEKRKPHPVCSIHLSFNNRVKLTKSRRDVNSFQSLSIPELPLPFLDGLNLISFHVILKIVRRKVHVIIESMAFKGYGVARVGGKIVFIPYSVTGDEAWVEIVEEKRDYSIGRLEKIIERSPWRADPQCPYFGECGQITLLSGYSMIPTAPSFSN
jgi:predicted RNA-binding protein with TRAM domain